MTSWPCVIARRRKRLQAVLSLDDLAPSFLLKCEAVLLLEALYGGIWRAAWGVVRFGLRRVSNCALNPLLHLLCRLHLYHYRLGPECVFCHDGATTETCEEAS